MITPRYYQQEAHDEAMAWIAQSVDPCLIDLPTGAGKSIVVAMLANSIRHKSGKKTLCLQPSKELLEQNAAKYKATGESYSLFSASVKSRSTRHPVIFATPLSVKNHVSRFVDDFGAVILDEAHGITPTVLGIIEEMRVGNPNLRVIGMTATPFRLDRGYIYNIEPKTGRVGNEAGYFRALVYSLPAADLIAQGFLTPPLIGDADAASYDTSGLVKASTGRFTSESVDRAFVGHGRLTSAIVSDVVAKSARRRGVMFFGSTIQHCEEIMASLPPELSCMLTGKTPAAERAKIIRDFKARRIKYLVNVSVLTTGFDAEHCDVIALLRRTESVGLMQQIIGRGLRLYEGKENCLVLDYAGNVENHCPDGDVFDPNIRNKIDGERVPIDITCATCGTTNNFSARPNPDQYEMSDDGYFVDALGFKIETEEGIPIPSHFGRRCGGYAKAGAHYERCEHRWSTKSCEDCGAANDIAARRCEECRGELIDPNAKLAMDFAKFKRNPRLLQTDSVTQMEVKPSVSQNGNDVLRVDFVTPYRTFSIWLMKHPTHNNGLVDLSKFKAATGGGQHPPRTVTYSKVGDFYRVTEYDMPEDVCEVSS